MSTPNRNPKASEALPRPRWRHHLAGGRKVGWGAEGGMTMRGVGLRGIEFKKRFQGLGLGWLRL